MRQHGKLVRWNAERGFGFIAPAGGGADVFVHVSAFPRAGGPPVVDELVSFEVEPGDQGKARAVRVQRPPGATPRPAQPRPQPRPVRTPRRSGLAGWAAALTLAGAAAAFVMSDRPAPDASPADAATPLRVSVPPARLLSEQPAFQCDGRTRCSQMHSCEEANYFLAHCPGVEMDGDGDGVACEQQWCGDDAAAE